MIIIEIILLTYFAYVTGYTLFFALCATIDGKGESGGRIPEGNLKSKFCILIPAYKEDAVIINTAKRALDQNYPSDSYDVVVIADCLKESTIRELVKLPVITLRVSFKKSTKVKSLNAAMDQLRESYDYGVILDADNVMEKNFLELANKEFLKGKHKAIQGQRKPKNQQNTLSFLDAVSESINTSIFRKGTSKAGLSSSISGSGFAVEYQTLKDQLSSMNAIGGFDRELEILLLIRGIKVKYIHHLIVYDEKVSNSGHFENQRKRWISSQYYYLVKYFKRGITAFFAGNIALFNSTILRNLQLPRLLNIGTFTFFTLIAVLLGDFLTIPYSTWILLYGVYAFATLIAIPGEFYSLRLLYSMVKLPMLFIRMLSALIQIKKANKRFIHTPHEI